MIQQHVKLNILNYIYYMIFIIFFANSPEKKLNKTVIIMA